MIDAAATIADDARLGQLARERLEALVRATEQGWFGADAGGGDAVADVPDAEDRARGEDLVRAVTDVGLGLEHHRPPGPWRWWFPPSLRRSASRAGAGARSRTPRRRRIGALAD